LKYILKKGNLFLKELVSTGSGLRTTKLVTEACVYNDLKIAKLDATDYGFKIVALVADNRELA